MTSNKIVIKFRPNYYESRSEVKNEKTLETSLGHSCRWHLSLENVKFKGWNCKFAGNVTKMSSKI